MHLKLSNEIHRTLAAIGRNPSELELVINGFERCDRRALQTGLVITTWNRFNFLERTIASISNSRLNDCLVVIVDDHSDDPRVRELIVNANFDAPTLCIFKNKNSGVANSLELGWSFLVEWGCHTLVNLDSDTLVKENWLSVLHDLYPRLGTGKDKTILSGFSRYNDPCILFECKDYLIKSKLGAVNYYFDNSAYPLIKSFFKHQDSWDWSLQLYIEKHLNDGYTLVSTKPSVVQHIGTHGINSVPHAFDFARDFDSTNQTQALTDSGVRYYSFLEPSGYGLAAIAYIQALIEQNVAVYWTPLVITENGYRPWTEHKDARKNVESLLKSCVSESESDVLPALISCLDRPKQGYGAAIIHTVPEYWPFLREDNILNIGYTVWETTVLPAHFPDLINQVDRVFVPAHFNVSIFKNSSVTIPISVIPHILSSLRLPNRTEVTNFESEISHKAEDFVFYSINEWNARKAMWTLLECYLEAFSADDAVVLIIKTSATGVINEDDDQQRDTQKMMQAIRVKYANPAKIITLTNRLESNQMDVLHAIGDCFISTTHTEGWGLGAFEAAGRGNPVIITGWGGHLDYLGEDSKNLVEYDLVHVRDACGGGSYSQDQQWAKVKVGHVVKRMQEIFREPKLARQDASKLARRVKEKFNRQTIGQTLIKAINEE